MRYRLLAVAAVAIALVSATSATGQDQTATVRTYQGLSYGISEPSLEFDYNIGEVPESKAPTPQFGTTINVTSVATAAPGGTEQGGGEKSPPLLKGHARATEIKVSAKKAEFRIPFEDIRAMRFSRAQIQGSEPSLPPYIASFKHAVSIDLMNGEKVEADYVNLGGAVVRGNSMSGRVEIPWQEVESIVFQK